MISYCSKHSHFMAEVGMIAFSDGDTCEPEDGLIEVIGAGVTIWEGGVRAGAIPSSPMLFDAYKLECENTTKGTTRRIRRITNIPLINRIFPVFGNIFPRKTLLRSTVNRCA